MPEHDHHLCFLCKREIEESASCCTVMVQRGRNSSERRDNRIFVLAHDKCLLDLLPIPEVLSSVLGKGETVSNREGVSRLRKLGYGIAICGALCAPLIWWLYFIMNRFGYGSLAFLIFAPLIFGVLIRSTVWVLEGFYSR